MEAEALELVEQTVLVHNHSGGRLRLLIINDDDDDVRGIYPQQQWPYFPFLSSPSSPFSFASLSFCLLGM